MSQQDQLEMPMTVIYHRLKAQITRIVRNTNLESADDMSDEGGDHSDVPGVEESAEEHDSSAATGFASFECAAHAFQRSLQAGLSVTRSQTLLKAGKRLVSISTIVPLQQRLSRENSVRITSQRRYFCRNVSQDGIVIL